MPKFNKPDQPNQIWASNALSEDIADPDSNGDVSGLGGTYNILDGWGQEKPPYQIENYSMNKLYQGFAYYNQHGFPEWDSATEYQAGKSYVQGSNNVVYKCIQTHINKNPAVAGNESFWERFGQKATDNTVLESIFQVLFPVGSVVMRSTNPGNTILDGGLGFGTWTKIEGRSIIGEGSYTDSRGETKSFTRGNSEGTFKHKLTITEMPSHNHLINLIAASDEGTGTAKGHNTNNITHTKPTQSTGGDAAHNNIHPVFAAPIWYRTS